MPSSAGRKAVIVIGAHRSGTSLASAMVRALGVHMGADCGVLGESAFFRTINVRLLRAVGASWHRPAPIDSALRHAGRRAKLERMAQRAVVSKRRAGYLGQLGSERCQAIADLEHAWGWKDPRTTVTLPIWLQVFEHARVIHIVRNGIDVARSLIRRERGGTPRLGSLRYLFGRACPWRWPDAERKPRPFNSTGEAFDLWAHYVQAGIDTVAPLMPGAAASIRYEDVLEDPAESARRVAALLGLRPDRARIARWAGTVAAGRGFAFVSDPDASELHRRFANHELMHRFGYDRPPAFPGR